LLFKKVAVEGGIARGVAVGWCRYHLPFYFFYEQPKDGSTHHAPRDEIAGADGG